MASLKFTVKGIEALKPPSIGRVTFMDSTKDPPDQRQLLFPLSDN